MKPKVFDLLAFLMRHPGQVDQPRPAARAGLGLRLPGRDADGRRPRPLAALRDRARRPPRRRSSRRSAASATCSAARRRRPPRPETLTGRTSAVHVRPRRSSSCFTRRTRPRPTTSRHRGSAGPARRTGVRATAPGDALASSTLEVARLLRVRHGELAEPLALATTVASAVRVAAILSQLEPIRTHSALRSSWEREASRGPDVRLAYAMAFLSLDRRASAPRARRRKSRVAFSPITAHA